MTKVAAALCLASLSIVSSQPSHAQAKPGIERLYILNCGEGVAGDISRWSPGANVGKTMDFVDNCYLIKHAQGWLLWDTGVTDAIADMPEGQKPADARATHWKRPKTLASQLEQLGVKPSDVKYVAVSHTHPDHIGNITMFPQCCWYRRLNTSGQLRSVRVSNPITRSTSSKATTTFSATGA